MRRLAYYFKIWYVVFKFFLLEAPSSKFLKQESTV